MHHFEHLTILQFSSIPLLMKHQMHRIALVCENLRQRSHHFGFLQMLSWTRKCGNIWFIL